MSLAFSYGRHSLRAALGLFLGVSALAAVACTAAPTPSDDFVSKNPQPQKKPVNDSGTETTKGADASVPPPPPATCVSVAPNNRCGLDPQCGCGANETCDVTNETTGATSCVSGGGATLGRPCAQTGDCLAGLTCSYGACRPYCKTPRSKCAVSGTDLCVEVMGKDNKPITNKSVCTIQCDPRQPSAVCGSNACEWLPTYYAPSKVTDCNFAGTVPVLGVCKSTGDCLPAHACITHPKYGLECEKWCRIGQAGDCPTTPAGTTCKDTYGTDAPVIGGVKLGTCQD